MEKNFGTLHLYKKIVLFVIFVYDDGVISLLSEETDPFVSGEKLETQFKVARLQWNVWDMIFWIKKKRFLDGAVDVDRW